jgi:hypothetical protein
VEDWAQSPASELSDQERWAFFLRLWIRQGSEQRRQDVARRLEGLIPSQGYRRLADLVKLGCVGAIITTNFDLMLDQVLVSVPHRRIVGPPEPSDTGDSPPELELVKVHGDIRDGGILFEPRELHSLPGFLTNKIRELTAAPVLVIGYRGQDNGFMSSLNREMAFNAFWASPHPFLPDDEYLYAPVVTWMHQRNSSSNFLNGEFGDFDKLMEKLYRDLSSGSGLPVTHEPVAERVAGPVFDMLRNSTRAATLYDQLMEVIRAYESEHPLVGARPFGAPSSQSVMDRFVEVMTIRHLSPRLQQVLTNELEALAFLIAVAVHARHGDDARAGAHTIAALSERLLTVSGWAKLDATFWALVRVICGYAPPGAVPLVLAVHFNHRTSLTLISECNDPARLRTAFRYLCQLCFFVKGEMSEDVAATELGERLRSIRGKVTASSLISEQTTLQLEPLTADELDCLKKLTGVAEFAAPNDGSNSIVLSSDWLRVVTSKTATAAAVASPTATGSFVDVAIGMADQSSSEFLSLHDAYGISPGKMIPLSLDATLETFADGPFSAMLIVGASGTGKTTALKRFVRTDRDRGRRVIVRAPKLNSMTTSALDLFFSLKNISHSEARSALETVNSSLASRDQTLVLMLDGLNEYGGDLDAIVELYRDIIRLATLLARQRLGRIKIILSVRSYLFRSLKQMAGAPPAEVFFTPEASSSAKDIESGVVRVGALNFSEVRELANVFFKPDVLPLFLDLVSNLPQLAKQYAHPFLLAVAGSVASRPDQIGQLHSSGLLFARFADQMLERLEDRQNDALGLIHRYFDQMISQDRPSGAITEFSLCRDYGKAATELIRIVEDAQIFQVNSVGMISFAHDRIAEHFLGHYLFDRLGDATVVSKAFRLCASNPVFYGGIRALIWRLLYTGRTDAAGSHRGAAVHALINDYHLPNGAATTELLLEAITETRPEENHLYNIVRNAPDQAAFDGQLAQAMWRCAEYLPSALLITHVDPALERLRAHSSLIASSNISLALGILISDSSPNALKAAEARLRRIDGASKSSLAPIWHDRYRIVEARIARDQGRISESITVLRELYESQIRQDAWAQAAASALELGRALRDNAQFDETLAVYQRIGGHSGILPNHLAARLELQTATVEKNLLQQALKRPESDIRAAQDRQQLALDHLDQAQALARAGGIVSLEIEAAVERVEVLLVLVRHDPHVLLLASEAATEAERLLTFAPLHKQAVPFQRQLSKIAEQEGRLDDAMAILQAARKFAEQLGREFYVADCDYQLGRMIAHTQSLLELDDVRRVGIEALMAAIAFYEAKCAPDIVYKQDCRQALKVLLER